jgi:hypothetical protein
MTQLDTVQVYFDLERFAPGIDGRASTAGAVCCVGT